MPVTARTLWLADHLLVSEKGHHVSYNGFIADAASRIGWDVKILCAKNYDAEVPGGFEMDGIFRPDWRSSPPTWVTRHRVLLDLLEKLTRHRFRQDLERGFPPCRAKKDDIVFAEMLAPRNLAGWLRWLLSLPMNSEPVLVLHLGYASERFGADPEIPALLEDLRRAGKISRTRFVTDSEDLQEKYRRILGRPVAQLPVVISRRAGECWKPPGKPPVFTCLGNARREKGFVEILAAVDVLNSAATPPAANFVLQISYPDEPCAAALANFRSASAPNVRLISHPLSDDAYLHELTATDILLVPYHADRYGDRTSGVFCEATTAGKPMIATEGTLLGRDVAADGSGWIVRDRDAQSLADAITRAIAEHDRVAARSRELMARYGPMFHPDTFVAGLIALADDEH